MGRLNGGATASSSSGAVAAAAGGSLRRLSREKELEGLRVTLDVGHGYDPQGRYDPGTSTWDARRRRWLDEYDLNQGACGRAASILEAQGADVVLLKNQLGAGLTLEGRAQAAKDHGSHVFVSCHHNASNGVTQGSENFIHTAGTWADYSLARNIQDSLVERLGDLPNFADRGVKRGRMRLLETLPASVEAACLTEAYFIDSTPSHRPAGDKLSAEAGDAIAGGVRQYWMELRHPELAAKGLKRAEGWKRGGLAHRTGRGVGAALRHVGGLCLRARRVGTPVLVRALSSLQVQTLLAFGLGFATSKGVTLLMRMLQERNGFITDDTPEPMMCAPPPPLLAGLGEGAPAMEGEEETVGVEGEDVGAVKDESDDDAVADSDEESVVESDSDEELLDALEDCESDPEVLAVVGSAERQGELVEASASAPPGPPHEMADFFQDCKKEISVLVRKIEGWKAIYRETIGAEPHSSAAAESSKNPAVAAVLYDCLSEAEVHLNLLTESYVMRKAEEGYKSRVGTPGLPVIEAAELKRQASASVRDVGLMAQEPKDLSSGSSSPRCVIAVESSASMTASSSDEEASDRGSQSSTRDPSPLSAEFLESPQLASANAPRRTWRRLIGLAPGAEEEPVVDAAEVSPRARRSLEEARKGSTPLPSPATEPVLPGPGRPASMDAMRSPESKYRRALTQLVDSLRSPTKAPHPP